MFDLDDTLLDSQTILKDFREFLGRTLGRHKSRRYWTLVERFRRRCGCEDYLGVIQRYRGIIREISK